jgi:hypothetical protein
MQVPHKNYIRSESRNGSVGAFLGSPRFACHGTGQETLTGSETGGQCCCQADTLLNSGRTADDDSGFSRPMLSQTS